MEQSILKSTKKVLGIGPDDHSFDQDVLTHINGAFTILHQLGVGPDDGFWIEDDSIEWADFFPDETILSQARTIVYLRVKLIFDPPSTSYAIAALENQIKEHEWRLNIERESTEWRDPDPPVVVNGE